MTSSINKEDSRSAKEFVFGLLSKGIKVLALDFDQTIVSVHTAGFWKGGTPKLAEHVRPAFKALIQEALESPLHVCIVTYSMQPLLIYDVLKLVLPRSDIKKMIIRANSAEWSPQSDLPGLCLGKEQHLAWIVTALFNKKKVIIQPDEILLLDDDEENVHVAKDFGHQAYLVKEDVSLPSLLAFVESELPDVVGNRTVTLPTDQSPKKSSHKKKRASTMGM